MGEISKTVHIAYLAVILVLVLAGSSAIYAWYTKKGPVETIYQPVNMIGTYPKLDLVTLPCHPVQTVKNKAKFVEKEGIPAGMIRPGDQITGMAILKPSAVPSRLVSTITDTGETSFIIIPGKRSFFGFENEKRIGLRCGLDLGWQKKGELFADWSFARAGNVYTGIYAELNSDKQGKAMLEISYKF